MRRALSVAERQEIHSLTLGRCLYCRNSVGVEEMEVDHLYPVSKGGSSDKRNLVPACKSCNRKKHARIIMDDAPRPFTPRREPKPSKGIPGHAFKGYQIVREVSKVRRDFENPEKAFHWLSQIEHYAHELKGSWWL